MSYGKLLPILIVASSVVSVSDRAEAQTRAVPRGGSVVVGQAVPRPAPGPRSGPGVVAPRIGGFAPYRPYYGYRPYYPYRSGLRIGIYAGYPFGYYPYPYASYGFYGYAPPAGYVVPVPTAAYGSLRIQGASPDAQVFADGYYVGTVDDFDGAYQRLNLPAGPHHIEIRVPGSAPIEFDVRTEPGQTITYRAEQP
ncbi:MAG: hypothetical protein A3G76_05915 [Acidobacteria bacterium RIFCSPLOWO2_12_FULL_65_11]|nr:MAG: hypothetical protein A3H95_11120 [Acidobacteria bacterium RIFCSPLOWO2_02_FULL_64_15]OFW28035.1 MAG: hypothetical protein A3G76_05915 [Acidobacteria bacterium RIFCSPLOWO2_12_FULL_65_11]